MTLILNRIRKAQVHSAELQTWNYRGQVDFTQFNPALILAGDNWRCGNEGTGVAVNNIDGNVYMYKGDISLALVNNPGALNHANINNGNWEIIRKNPIGSGTKISKRDGGYLFESSIDNDYHYLCVEAGIAESMDGARDGTATWKKTPLTLST